MSPKEKAKILFDTSLEIVSKVDKYSYLTREEEITFAKLIATTIAADIYGSIDYDYILGEMYAAYWQRVILEITRYEP